MKLHRRHTPRKLTYSWLAALLLLLNRTFAPLSNLSSIKYHRFFCFKTDSTLTFKYVELTSSDFQVELQFCMILHFECAHSARSWQFTMYRARIAKEYEGRSLRLIPAPYSVGSRNAKVVPTGPFQHPHLAGSRISLKLYCKLLRT